MPGKGSIGWSSWRGSEKKPEIDAENEWDIIEKKTLPMDTGGGVKVLSEKTRSNNNFKIPVWILNRF
jgi:hypothetical protein